MISAFALGGAVLDEPRYAEAARRAAEFILERLYDAGTGVLLRRYRQGDAAIPGFLDDYALFAQALLDLYEAQFDLRHLEAAIRLTEKQSELFEDPEHGGFFSSAAGDARPGDAREGRLRRRRALRQFGGAFEPAAPGPDSPTARISANRPSACWPAFAPRLGAAPVALPQMLAACEFFLAEPRQIVLAGERGRADTEALVRAFYARFLPHRIVLLVDSPDTRRGWPQWIPEIAVHARDRRPCRGVRLPQLRLPVPGSGRGIVRRIATISVQPSAISTASLRSRL